MTVQVVDMGSVTALGRDTETLWQALCTGRSGLAPVRRFATDAYVTNLAACMRELDAECPQSRLDTLIAMLFEGIQVPRDCHLYTASTKAGVDQLERHERGQDRNLDRVLGHQVARQVASVLNIAGPRQNISAACASATVALALAAARIASGRAEAALVCGLDVVSEFIFSGFSALKALSSTVCRPFDTARDGLNLGEGAAYLVLMSEDRCRREGRTSLGTLRGWGIAGDASHITAPSREGEGLILAVRQALHRARVSIREIGAISAHGTGSVYNDAMELTAFGKVFDQPRPLHSVKGATGHTMGASGAIETILGLCSLREGFIPPTVGLREPDASARAWVAAETQPLRGGLLLNTNSGFGGINAALILERGDA
jgi:3-oxoacyl-[acyl-carrier-protein] synthase II